MLSLDDVENTVRLLSGLLSRLGETSSFIPV
jgi:hypothetical protein